MIGVADPGIAANRPYPFALWLEIAAASENIMRCIANPFACIFAIGINTLRISNPAFLKLE